MREMAKKIYLKSIFLKFFTFFVIGFAARMEVENPHAIRYDLDEYLAYTGI